jgi:uncharacterized alpha-E superfamily protein
MLSRVANSLFWLGRYVERAENSARFLSVTHAYAQELRGVSHPAADACWEVARTLILGDPAGEETGPVALQRLAFDAELANSILWCVSLARENARGIRDAIASEMWEELNVVYLMLQQEAGVSPSEAAQLSLLQRMRNAAHLFQGLRDQTMVRTDEWHFLCLGQYLERADQTARILDAMFSHPALKTASESGHTIDTLHLAVTLRACTAFEAYSSVSPALLPGRVAEFLLLDARFPRSVEFCVQELGHSLHVLSGTPHDLYSNEAEQRCGRLVAELRFAAINDIFAQGLHDYLEGVLRTLEQIGQSISHEYFR